MTPIDPDMHILASAVLSIDRLDAHASGPEYWVPLYAVQYYLQGSSSIDYLASKRKTVRELVSMYHDQEQAAAQQDQRGLTRDYSQTG